MSWCLILLLLVSQQAQTAKKAKPPKPQAPPVTASHKGAWNDAEPRGRKAETDGFDHVTLWEFYTLPGARVRCGEVNVEADSQDHLRYFIFIDGHSVSPIYYMDQQSAEDRVQEICDARVK